MANNFLDGLNRLLGGNPSAQKVSEDLQLTSELILLVRMMFADGTLRPEEMVMFKKICTDNFGLDEKDIPGILEYLKDFGYETTTWDAASMFSSHDVETKKTLLVHLMEIAKSDNDLNISEAEMIRKTAKVLGLTAQDIADSRK